MTFDQRNALPRRRSLCVCCLLGRLPFQALSSLSGASPRAQRRRTCGAGYTPGLRLIPRILFADVFVVRRSLRRGRRSPPRQGPSTALADSLTLRMTELGNHACIFRLSPFAFRLSLFAFHPFLPALRLSHVHRSRRKRPSPGPTGTAPRMLRPAFTLPAFSARSRITQLPAVLAAARSSRSWAPWMTMTASLWLGYHLRTLAFPARPRRLRQSGADLFPVPRGGCVGWTAPTNAVCSSLTQILVPAPIRRAGRARADRGQSTSGCSSRSTSCRARSTLST